MTISNLCRRIAFFSRFLQPPTTFLLAFYNIDAVAIHDAQKILRFGILAECGLAQIFFCLGKPAARFRIVFLNPTAITKGNS